VRLGNAINRSRQLVLAPNNKTATNCYPTKASMSDLGKICYRAGQTGHHVQHGVGLQRPLLPDWHHSSQSNWPVPALDPGGAQAASHARIQRTLAACRFKHMCQVVPSSCKLQMGHGHSVSAVHCTPHTSWRLNHHERSNLGARTHLIFLDGRQWLPPAQHEAA
jgi:hypothetical protein